MEEPAKFGLFENLSGVPCGQKANLWRTSGNIIPSLQYTRPGKRLQFANLNITMFNGKTHYVDWAIFNSKRLVYQRVSFYSIPALLETGGLVLDPFILGLPMAAFVFDIGGKFSES